MMKMWLLLACAHMHSTHFFIGLTFSICGAGKREQIRVTAKGSKSCGKKTKAKGEDLLLALLIFTPILSIFESTSAADSILQILVDADI